MFIINELLEILQGLKSELIPAILEPDARKITEQNFDNAMTIVVNEIQKQQSPEIQLAYQQGKIEGLESSINALMRQK